MWLQYFHRYVVPDNVKQQALQVMDDNIHYLGPHTRALEVGLASAPMRARAFGTIW
jgi:hypothetical protein